MAEPPLPVPAGSARVEPARVAQVAQRLSSAEWTLKNWGYAAEVMYAWLGLISWGVAGFAAYSHGGAVYRSPSMTLGLTSVGLSVFAALVGWFQARNCRRLGRRCGAAANSLEPGGPVPPAAQLLSLVPSLGDIESSLRARQRTSWLGALFAVVGLQAMVGLLVTKVLAASGGLAPAPGVSLDIFTLLAVSNSALSHVIGGGIAAWQQKSLPPAHVAAEDPFRGWGRQ